MKKTLDDWMSSINSSPQPELITSSMGFALIINVLVVEGLYIYMYFVRLTGSFVRNSPFTLYGGHAESVVGCGIELPWGIRITICC